VSVLARLALAAAAPLFLAAPLAHSATPLACEGTCYVQAATTGYTLPALVLANNSTVVWNSTDIGHLQRETSLPLSTSAACFSAPVSGGNSSAGVRFDIAGATLAATLGTTTATCTNAVPTPDGGFALAYHCAIHPNMRGVLVVEP
jgi:hypothetical protein